MISPTERRLGPYRILDELGAGGMGTVYRAEQLHPVRRLVALKTIRSDDFSDELLARFEVECQALASMDHPGVAKVLDVGVSADGRPYLAMELVEGEPLTAFCQREALDRTARLELFIAICLAVQHAHQRGIIHRDLKPSNILVQQVDGRSQPKLIDFGIARSLDAHLTERAYGTRAGVRLGTPEYMSPEQAEADPLRMDTRCDVFSLGVILHELATGELPVANQRRPALRGDLRWIVQKAAAARPADRYATAAELASDVQRHLQGKPTVAGSPGPIDRSLRLVRHHRGLVTWLALVAIVLVASRALIHSQRRRALANEAERVRFAAAASESARRARAQAELADERGVQILRLSALRDLLELCDRSTQLWAPLTDHIDEMQAWLVEARALGERLGSFEATREERRSSGSVRSASLTDEFWADDPLVRQIKELDENLAFLRALPAADFQPILGAADAAEERRAREAMMLDLRADLCDRLAGVEYLSFDDPQDSWWYEEVRTLCLNLRRFVDPETGLIDGVSRRWGLGVARRLERAYVLQEIMNRDETAQLWDDALFRIWDSPHYEGLEMERQVDLIPLGPDPRSGLWEFAHPLTGEVPTRDAVTGELARGPETCLVLVLLPGGSFRMGASTDPADPAHDPDAQSTEMPPHEILLRPFFLSKYELTEAIWTRFTGQPVTPPDRNSDPMFPVRNFSWDRYQQVVQWMGLELPTEAQFEYAARGGTSTPFWWGADPSRMSSLGNIADSPQRARAVPQNTERWSDGYAFVAPVGSFPPNPFGLHEVLGNVMEVCRDRVTDYVFPAREGTGERDQPGVEEIIVRGGSYYFGIEHARASSRFQYSRTGALADIGLRPSRALR